MRFGIRKILFSGTHATCPLCLNNIRGWAPHGGGAKILAERKVVGGMLRPNDRCPICHGADRTRLMMFWLEKMGRVGEKPVSVLHVAPEYGLYLWLMRQPNIDYVGCDIDKSRYRHIRNMVDADLTALPISDDRFDIVLCSHVLEHVVDDLSAMREIRRVLRPDGTALLLVPEAIDGSDPDEDPNIVSPEERHEHFGQWDHVRLYTRELFNERLTQAGFSIKSFNPFERNADEATKLRLNPLERLRVVKKFEANI